MTAFISIEDRDDSCNYEDNLLMCDLLSDILIK